MDCKKKTIVSVVMCTYNGACYIRQQLDSILAQTYPADEIIIQDDCSTDNTLQIVGEYAEKYPAIKVYANEYNCGYNGNFFSAIFKASGDAIAISDQDDVWKPTKLERQVELFDKGYSLVFHNSELFDSEFLHSMGMRHVAPPEVSELRLALKPFIPGHECLFTAQVVPLLHAACSKENKLAYAYVIALACCTIGKIAYINEPLVSWRRHEKAATFVHKNHIGAIVGIVKSLTSLFRSNKRDIPARYFAAVGVFPYRYNYVRRVVKLMQGGIPGLFAACVVCVLHTADLLPGIYRRNYVKSFFAPLHLVREGDFLIK